jgi:hypothetical protein
LGLEPAAVLENATIPQGGFEIVLWLDFWRRLNNRNGPAADNHSLGRPELIAQHPVVERSKNIPDGLGNCLFDSHPA